MWPKILLTGPSYPGCYMVKTIPERSLSRTSSSRWGAPFCVPGVFASVFQVVDTLLLFIEHPHCDQLLLMVQSYQKRLVD